MYLTYKGAKYPCTCKPGAAMVYRGLPDDFPAPVEGEIALHANDGFLLRTDNTADYLRQTFAGGVLTLTNAPEPEIVEEETVEEEPTQLDIIEAQVMYTAMMTDTLLEV